MVRDRAIGLRGPVNWSRAASSTLVWGWSGVGRPPDQSLQRNPYLVGLPSASSFGASRPSTVKTRLSHLSLSRAPRPSRPCIGVSVMPPAAAQPSRRASKRKEPVVTEPAEPAPAPAPRKRRKDPLFAEAEEAEVVILTTPLEELINRYPFQGTGYEEQVRSRARKNPFLEPHASPRVMHPPKLSVRVPYPAARSVP